MKQRNNNARRAFSFDPRFEMHLKVPTCPVEKPAPFLKYSSVAEMEKKKKKKTPHSPENYTVSAAEW